MPLPVIVSLIISIRSEEITIQKGKPFFLTVIDGRVRDGEEVEAEGREVGVKDMGYVKIGDEYVGLFGRGRTGKRKRQPPICKEGLCTGCHKTRIYVTIEYFLLEDFEGYTGDGEGRISQTRLKVQDVFAMTESLTRILTQWNRHNQPVGESSSLLAGFLGQLASNFGNFLVLYENWLQVPEQYKNNVYVNTIQANFVVNDEKHKQYILGSLGKKWKDKRCRLFDKYHNWELSMDENIQKHPPYIPQDHWAIFVRYRRTSKAMDIANKNAANRAKLVIPHVLGSKTLARKRDELETIHGREFSRTEMYQLSHKKHDGTFVNEEARELHEKLQEEMQNCSENEAFLRVCGKEHPGYVRGMGLGVSPSQIIGSSSGATSSTTSVESNERMEQMQDEIESLKVQVAEIDSLKAQVAEVDFLKQ
ncbi:hypothetical protein Fmac_021219 [Flemingia macrophylla]|uniref:Transposase n=1 Tax=Flemingia macrophylla TaxID=520843 RepID=A0ABD1LW77_9FABA